MTLAAIAIIDDDDALCSSLVDLMRSIDYRAEPFPSVEAYLAGAGSFDCVVADIHLPGISGLELARKLRACGSNTPVILITSLPDKSLEDEADLMGVEGLLTKPFEPASLLDCVRKSLANERSSRHGH